MITEKSYLEAKKLILDYESEQLNKPVFSGSAHTEEEAEPYCHNCGEDNNLKYNEQYANGEYWACNECGENFFFTKRQYFH